MQAGIPVVGHVGLTPQRRHGRLGGYRAQGRTAEAALAVIDDALALQTAGCSMLVVEAVPSEVTAALVPLLDIPVIGIGAGADADGQGARVPTTCSGCTTAARPSSSSGTQSCGRLRSAGVEAYAAEVRRGSQCTPRASTGMRCRRGKAARLEELLRRGAEVIRG